MSLVYCVVPFTFHVHDLPRFFLLTLELKGLSLIDVSNYESGSHQLHLLHVRPHPGGGGGGALGYFLGGYVPPGTPNWHPVLEKISPKIDTPF